MAGSGAYRRAGGCRRRTPARSVRARCWSTRELGDVRRDRARKGKEVAWDITEEAETKDSGVGGVVGEADPVVGRRGRVPSDRPLVPVPMRAPHDKLWRPYSKLGKIERKKKIRAKFSFYEQRELGVGADGHGLSRRSGMVLSSEWIDA
uniref:Uncharacterized protein n=1 Tax=Oryza glumipatula TaxID=40148 RepID=A0A0E0B451_9ORYZ